MKERYKEIDLTNDKINRIVNAGFEVFAMTSYDKASTNAIVKKANVSRGLLYHYFEDKEALYKFLIYISNHIMIGKLNEAEVWLEKDFIKRMRQSVLIKFGVIKEYPHIINFYLNLAKTTTIEDMKKEMGVEFVTLLYKFYSSEVDKDLFKEGIDIEKAKNVIRWTLEKNGEEYQQKIMQTNSVFNVEDATKHIDTYINFLEDIFYR